MKPCIIRTEDLSSAESLWLHNNFLVPNGVRHWVPRGSDLVIVGNFLSVETLDLERPGQGRNREPGRRWRRWRSTWNIRKHGLPLKERRYRIRRSLEPTELERFRRFETPVVIPIGEYGEDWLVTGTNDAHSAEEAVRAMWEADLEPDDYQDQYGDVQLGDLQLIYRPAWAWKRFPGRSADEPLDEGDELVHGGKAEGLPRFAGYLVSL